MLSTSARTNYLYQSSTFVESQIPVAASLLLNASFLPCSTSDLTISALCLRGCCWSVLDTTISNSLRDHMELSSFEQSANSSELLATFSGYFFVPCDASPQQLGESGFTCLSQESLRIREEPTKSSRTLGACLHGGGEPQIGEVTCGGSLHLSCKP